VLISLLALVFAAPSGVPTAVEDPNHVGLRHWFEALRAAPQGRVARALHYGDSTIAADGIARTVRDRLVARFGDAGPGFVSAAFDGRWNRRSDVGSTKSGDWSTKTILLGGAGGRYGLGGIVGIGRDGASLSAWAVDAAAAIKPSKKLEVWYQAGAGYGTLAVKVDGKEVQRTPAVAPSTEDRRYTLEVPATFSKVSVSVPAGVVPLYGVVLETGKGGATWEALGVIGVGSKSFTTFAKESLASQVGMRNPDLIVVQLGGNEAGYPVLMGNKGAGYAPIFEGALATIRAGAPDASCLVVTPLDQGFVEEETGESKSRPGMPNLVARQRDVALAAGCAFWSAWGAMGGQGSALKWSASSLGTGDLVHVSGKGQALIGNLLSDALLQRYDAWSSGG
jgi:hypothetical protein